MANRIIKTPNYDYVVTGDSGQFIGILDQNGEPVLFADVLDGVPSTVANFTDLGDKISANIAGINTSVANALAARPLTTAMNAAITAAVNGLLNGAPGALDTLKELADALGDDPNYATSMISALAAKASITYVDAQVALRSLLGQIGVVAFTTRNLLTTDFGKMLEQQDTTNHTLLVQLAATIGVTWVEGKFFMARSDNTGAATVLADTANGVSFDNPDALAIVQGAPPLVFEMSRTTNRWLVRG